MYLPFLNDFIVPKVGWAVSSLVDLFNKGIDFFFHQGIPGLFDRVSFAIRSIQSGYLKSYIKIVAGSIMIFLIIFSLVGW
jgi:NADH-quinone oxidoreductase subunit L